MRRERFGFGNQAVGGDGWRSRRRYSALDREFSEPVLKAYEKQAGVRIDAKYDVESTKTLGLTQLIAAEAQTGRTRCDLFWNNEILNTLRLKKKGLLRPFHPANAADYPEAFRDKDGTWYGFAARARNRDFPERLKIEDGQLIEAMSEFQRCIAIRNEYHHVKNVDQFPVIKPRTNCTARFPQDVQIYFCVFKHLHPTWPVPERNRAAWVS